MQGIQTVLSFLVLQHVCWADNNEHFFIYPHCAWDLCCVGRELASIDTMKAGQSDGFPATFDFYTVVLQIVAGICAPCRDWTTDGISTSVGAFQFSDDIQIQNWRFPWFRLE